MFKLLALHHGRSVSVDRLVDAVWPDALPARPVDQLAVLVSRLRNVIGRHRIRFSDAGYRLEVDWLDLDEFDERADRAAAEAAAGNHLGALEAARKALGLARDPLLSGEIDATWADSARRSTERTVARVLRIAAGAALALGEVDEAIEFAASSLDADPFDEESLRLLMLAEERRGCTAAGLAAYARLRTHLADELGVDPSGDTEAVHLALLRQGEVPPTRAVITPMACEPVVAFVGRDDVLALLDDELALVRSARSRLVIIEGEAGIGKSALLLAFGRRAVAVGALWLHGACDPLFGQLPLQSVVDALTGHVAQQTAIEATALLAGEQAVLGPLLATATPPRFEGWSDALAGNSRLLQAFDAVFARLTATRPVVLVIDDIHLAGSSTVELLAYLTRRLPRLLVIVARRPAVGPTIVRDRTLYLGPLDLAAAVALVGPERGPALHARSGGNPLFLTQLASVAPDSPLPTSLVEAVMEVANALGAARPTVIAAAVIGTTIDVELLAAVLHVAPLELVSHLDVAGERRLLDDTDRGYAFCHAVVRETLADAASPARAALLHREAARVLRERLHADPLEVAHHARLGGDTELAADALEQAAVLAAQRFDRPATEELLDQALRWSDTPGRRLARARTRTMRGRYDAALDDVAVALSVGAGAAALEAGAWAAYFARRFDDARSFADDGATLAADPVVRASCLTVAGRVRHAAGDLVGAEPLLQEAVACAEGPARAVPTVWLGVLRSHQSRPVEALGLLRQITRVESGTERTTELLHALLFTAHAYALQGRPVDALDALQRYDTELGRRQVPRFAGRASNFRGWVLRALGQWDRADDENRRAADELGAVDFPETLIASSLDLAASALLRGDAAAADEWLRQAESQVTPHLTFGWRLGLRLRLERARLALSSGEPAVAAHTAALVARDAERLGVVRYSTVARLTEARARARTGAVVDLDSVGRDVEALDAAVGVDAWWVTAEVAGDLHVTAWRDQAFARATLLARASGPEDVGLARAVSKLIG